MGGSIACCQATQPIEQAFAPSRPAVVQVSAKYVDNDLQGNGSGSRCRTPASVTSNCQCLGDEPHDDGTAVLNDRVLFASRAGDTALIIHALDSGADIETRQHPKDRLRRRMEDEAVDEFQEVLVLVDQGVFRTQGLVAAPPPTTLRRLGLTPLMWAAKSAHVNAVELLLERRATPFAQDEDGMTPLHFAAHAGSLECCRLLMQRGANRWVRDDYDRDAYSCLPKDAVATSEGQAAWEALLRPPVGGVSRPDHADELVRDDTDCLVNDDPRQYLHGGDDLDTAEGNKSIDHLGVQKI